MCQTHAFSHKQFSLILVIPQWNNFHYFCLVGERWWATQLRYRILNFMAAFNLFFHFLHPIVCFWRAGVMSYLSLYLKNERKMCCFSNDVKVPSPLGICFVYTSVSLKTNNRDPKILFFFFQFTKQKYIFLKNDTCYRIFFRGKYVLLHVKWCYWLILFFKKLLRITPGWGIILSTYRGIHVLKEF